MDASFSIESAALGLLDFQPAATAGPAAPIAAAEQFTPPPTHHQTAPAPGLAEQISQNHEASQRLQQSTSAIAAWNAAVAAQMQAGCTKAVATRNVAVAQPSLHAAFLQAFNSREHSQTAPAPAAGPIVAFEAAVTAEMRASSSTRAAATRAVIIRQPELHKAYVTALISAASP